MTPDEANRPDGYSRGCVYRGEQVSDFGVDVGGIGDCVRNFLDEGVPKAAPKTMDGHLHRALAAISNFVALLESTEPLRQNDRRAE